MVVRQVNREDTLLSPFFHPPHLLLSGPFNGWTGKRKKSRISASAPSVAPSPLLRNKSTTPRRSRKWKTHQYLRVPHPSPAKAVLSRPPCQDPKPRRHPRQWIGHQSHPCFPRRPTAPLAVQSLSSAQTRRRLSIQWRYPCLAWRHPPKAAWTG